jgi:hypothetical protein
VFYVVESHADEDGECAICSALGIHVEDDGSITEL